MFGFLTPVRSETSYPLSDAAAALAFWQALPKSDVFGAQEAVCKALADPVPRGIRSDSRLQALLQLDQSARTLVDALLASQDAAGVEQQSKSGRSWQAAFELCRSFGRAYGLVVRSIRDNGEFGDRPDCQALTLLRFFRQRQLELLLRPFTDDRAPAFSWKEIHDAYALAQARGLNREALPIKRDQSSGGVEARLEREYVNVLMQDLLNGGQFPPYEHSWVNRNLPRWCLALALKRDEGPADSLRFVVDPGSDAGLVRSGSEPVQGALCLDMTPLLKSLAAQIASLRDATERASEGPSLRRGRQLKVLQKVAAVCSAERLVFTRRGERNPTAVKVETAVGFPAVLRRIRNKPDDPPVALLQPAEASEAMTIAGFGAMSGANTTMQTSIAGSSLLTMVDQSDSGCRLQGPALANTVVPGAVIAFREYGEAPWSVGVVRRIKKRLAGRRIEIGVEYLSSSPRWVVIVVSNSDARPGKGSENESKRFAGLYLPESRDHPVLPMKTLVLPACGLSPGDRLSVRSRNSVYTVKLKEPLEEQADFLWSPFEILDRWVKNEPPSSSEAAVAA